MLPFTCEDTVRSTPKNQWVTIMVSRTVHPVHYKGMMGNDTTVLLYMPFHAETFCNIPNPFGGLGRHLPLLGFVATTL